MRPRLTAGILAMALFAAAGPAQAAGALHLYNWRNYTSPALVAKFEQAHDVEVTVTEYDSIAAALATIRAGGHGFDLVVPPANQVRILIEEGLALETRPDRMENFTNVAARWRDPPWDPRRRYSVPWQWGGIGMVVDTQVYDGDIDTSAIVFDPPAELAGKINVAPAMGEIIAMALLYVGAEPCTDDEAALTRAREVLVAARPKWRSMDYGIADSMPRGEIAAAAYWSSAALRARMAEPSIRFGYPREGYPLWMDSVVVLKDAVNADNAKLFQDFVMAPENAALISAFAGHANGIDGSEAFLPDGMKAAGEIVVAADAAEAGVFLPVCPEPVNELYTAIWTELTK
jgi:spermidine/putrescine transport system substrate-binding protein